MPSEPVTPTVAPTAPWRPAAIWIERAEASSPLARRIRARLPDVPVHVVDRVGAADDGARFVDGKQRLVVKRQGGSFLHHCPAGTPGLVCCNHLILEGTGGRC